MVSQKSWMDSLNTTMQLMDPDVVNEAMMLRPSIENSVPEIEQLPEFVYLPSYGVIKNSNQNPLSNFFICAFIVFIIGIFAMVILAFLTGSADGAFIPGCIVGMFIIGISKTVIDKNIEERTHQQWRAVYTEFRQFFPQDPPGTSRVPQSAIDGIVPSQPAADDNGPLKPPQPGQY